MDTQTQGEAKIFILKNSAVNIYFLIAKYRSTVATQCRALSPIRILGMIKDFKIIELILFLWLVIKVVFWPLGPWTICVMSISTWGTLLMRSV